MFYEIYEYLIAFLFYRYPDNDGFVDSFAHDNHLLKNSVNKQLFSYSINLKGDNMSQVCVHNMFLLAK